MLIYWIVFQVLEMQTQKQPEGAESTVEVVYIFSVIKYH